ncbi:MAG: DNA polymerase III subunit delta' [Candidatus Omnitrophota bacterium]
MVYSQNLTDCSLSTEAKARQLLKNAWENKRLASTYLFFGPPGSGKLLLARALSKTVNCQAESFPPCLTCPSCRKIEGNNHPDVHYLQKIKSNFIKIEQIQEMHREISLRPFEGKYKVFIILDAQDLTAEAANCLLKITEEPPKGSLLILIASDLRRIFATIISRCQKVRFSSLGRQEAKVILNRDYRLDERLSHYLAFAFEGRLGEALKFKDSDMISEKNQVIRYFLLEHFDQKEAVDKYDSKGRDELIWILKVLISCIRDIYLLKVGQGREELVNQDIKDELWGLSQKFSFIDLDRMSWQLSSWIENVKQNINPKLLIDNLRLLWKK